MITYNWNVTALYTETIEQQQNYVVIANYVVTATQSNKTKKTNIDTYTASIANIAYFTIESITPFIPYEDLTNDIVISWIKNQLGVDGVDNIEACLDGLINNQINPPVTPENTPLPF